MLSPDLCGHGSHTHQNPEGEQSWRASQAWLHIPALGG